MSFDLTKFNHRGMSWSDVAGEPELNAVLYRKGTERENLIMHSASLFGAIVALAYNRKERRGKGIILDFGCGVGRLSRFFGAKGWSVIGTEITAEMVAAARRFGLPKRSQLILTDGITIPLGDQSVDMIWVSGVLKYSLFAPGSPCRVIRLAPEEINESVMSQSFVPVYRDIAQEMYRVLKPGGFVVNQEMWIDLPPDVFTPDFERAGFITKQVRVLRRYGGRLEEWCEWHKERRLPPRVVLIAGQLCAALRFFFDNPRRATLGFSDYLFIWSKPGA
jgi:SAM-dependent methyltransferase